MSEDQPHARLNAMGVSRAGRSAWPIIALASALLITYGYEIFSFHLTMDEEVFGELRNIPYAERWIDQGRWAMALLTVLTPSPVVPVVSGGIGILLSGTAWWLLSKYRLGMSDWASAIAAALGGTIPVLAFIFSFSTIALGVGVGNMLIVAFAWAIASDKWVVRAVAPIAGATAIGIYDTFAIAIAALGLALVARRATVMSVGLAIGAVSVSLLLSRVLGLLTSWATGVKLGGYAGNYLDLEGLFSDPVGRLAAAARNVNSVVRLSDERFGLHSPWLAIAIGTILAVSIVSVLLRREPWARKSLRTAAVVCVALLPFGAEALAASSVPLRSQLYLPIVVIILAAIAFPAILALPARLGRFAQVAMAALVVLAIVGNATISNRLFASAEMNYDLDRALAFSIGQSKDILSDGDNTTNVPLVVSGKHAWPDSALTPTRETLGASFFEIGGGSQSRIAAFLRSQGVQVGEPTPQQSVMAWTFLDEMPDYPNPGWIRMEEGVLLVKFGDRTPANEFTRRGRS